ncbi:MAG: cobalamin B12-binding domain-containing protein [Actinobacteria bacterium]|nr:cobalamin B12-binding domain-containing protein [Actinomycetota bacterium]
MPEAPLVVGAALGDCVHTAGVLNFLAAARHAGYRSEFLGPAVAVDRVVAAASEHRPDLLALSYRLTPDSAERLFAQLRDRLAEAGLGGRRLVFGGTPVVAEVAERSGLFEAVFGAPGGPTVEEYLAGGAAGPGRREWAQTLVERCREAAPRPIIRHHFGLPGVDATVAGIERIAAAEVLDVVSLGPDQNFQEHFFHPERMDPAQDGAGGVPVRSADDLRQLYAATRRGNYPLLRSYSGTNDQVALAAVLHEAIQNAWCAVPVFWYSELDGRSARSLEDAIAEHAALVAWCAAHGVPVERNDQNQWGLRHASDTVQVAASALAAGLSAAAGVTTVVVQMMLNNPPGISPAMDVAKMAAMEHLVRARVGPGVAVLRETRGGLFSMPPDPDRARGQLAAAVRTGMLLRPDILHVVGHTEAHHLTGPGELISSCTLARQVVDDALLGLPDPLADPRVAARRDRLVEEAAFLLGAIEQRFPGAAGGDPAALAGAVRRGYLDAPYLAGIPAARGAAVTVVDGGCDAVDAVSGAPLPERERLAALG